jgi:hypothetical protein
MLATYPEYSLEIRLQYVWCIFAHGQGNIGILNQRGQMHPPTEGGNRTITALVSFKNRPVTPRSRLAAVYSELRVIRANGHLLHAYHFWAGIDVTVWMKGEMLEGSCLAIEDFRHKERLCVLWLAHRIEIVSEVAQDLENRKVKGTGRCISGERKHALEEIAPTD